MEPCNKVRLRLALECIRKFFANKTTRFGEPLPRKKLYSHLGMVATMDLIKACDIAYSTLANYRKPNHITVQSPTVGWDVEFVLGLLQEMKSMGIPKEFQGGLIVLYLKFCRGYMIAK